MPSISITNNQGQQFYIRLLKQTDAAQLGHFFERLSKQTCQRYAPHPMTPSFAQSLCETPSLLASRLIIYPANNQQIVGYFILDSFLPNQYPDDAKRYQSYAMPLTSNSRIFAPCMADAFQSQGLASAAMAFIKQYAATQAADKIVLMGGTQATNAQAVRFYQKNGFEPLGRFTTTNQSNHVIDNIDMVLPVSTNTLTGSI